MINAIKNCPGFVIFGILVLGFFLVLQTSGRASGGSKAPQRMDTKQIRSSAPGSWTYVYWAHGVRGK